MEDMLTVGDLHEGIGVVGSFIKGLQADTTVMVLGGLRIEHEGQQHVHVRLHYSFPLRLI